MNRSRANHVPRSHAGLQRRRRPHRDPPPIPARALPTTTRDPHRVNQSCRAPKLRGVRPATPQCVAGGRARATSSSPMSSCPTRTPSIWCHQEDAAGPAGHHHERAGTFMTAIRASVPAEAVRPEGADRHRRPRAAEPRSKAAGAKAEEFDNIRWSAARRRCRKSPVLAQPGADLTVITESGTKAGRPRCTITANAAGLRRHQHGGDPR